METHREGIQENKIGFDCVAWEAQRWELLFEHIRGQLFW